MPETMPHRGIGRVLAKRGENGKYRHVCLDFGPHYYVELHGDEEGRVRFVLGATHHGFAADASEIGGQLDRFINEIRGSHPESLTD